MSFFKSLTAFRLTESGFPAAEALANDLQKGRFKPCGSMDTRSSGWVPVRDGDDEGPLVHSVQRQMLLKLRTEKRLLPAGVIRREMRDRAQEIQKNQGFIPGRKQMREIKEAVIKDLLPRAFRDETHTLVWIDPVNRWMVVDGSPTRADDIIEHLKLSVEDLPLKPFRTVTSPGSAMTGWLAAGDGPDGFTIDRECELRAAAEERATVKYSRHHLDEDGVREHIKLGKQATRLALTYNDRVSFVLTSTGEIKKLAFLDILKESAAEEAENGDELFDAEFAIMTGELSKMLASLAEALGGEAQ
jgi:recombination associated protein RdgC